jgi:hypothetical protein
MTTISRPKWLPARRITMPLSNPVRKQQLSLSFAAAMALDWATCVIHRAHGQKPQGSSIARRALALYGRYLGALDHEQLHHEAIQVLHASTEYSPYKEDQQASFARLDAVPVDAPLPPLIELLCGPPGARMDPVALETKVDAMVREMYASRFARKAVQP